MFKPTKHQMFILSDEKCSFWVDIVQINKAHNHFNNKLYHYEVNEEQHELNTKLITRKPVFSNQHAPLQRLARTLKFCMEQVGLICFPDSE